jgi:hypothetical protein
MSADEREPFAARLLMQKLPPELSAAENKRWKSGLSDWKHFPREQAEFGRRQTMACCGFMLICNFPDYRG